MIKGVRIKGYGMIDSKICMEIDVIIKTMRDIDSLNKDSNFESDDIKNIEKSTLSILKNSINSLTGIGIELIGAVPYKENMK